MADINVKLLQGTETKMAGEQAPAIKDGQLYFATIDEGTKGYIYLDSNGKRFSFGKYAETAGYATEAGAAENAIKAVTATSAKNGVYYIEGDSSSTAGHWVGNNADITEYYNGLTVAYKIPIEGGSSKTYLKINSLTEVEVVKNATTVVKTTEYPVNSIVILTYTKDGSTAYWKIADYNTNTDTKIRQYVTSTNDSYPLLFTYENRDNVPTSSYEANYGRFNSSVYVNPSLGKINATEFEGALKGTADKAKEFAAATTVSLTGDATGTSQASTKGWTVPVEVLQAAKLKTARKIDGISFNGEADINRYAVCSTAGDTVAKTASILSGTFNLVEGAKVTVKFTYANTVANPTLNINSTGAKQIYAGGSALSEGQWWKSGAIIDFVYNGEFWVLTSGAGSGGGAYWANVQTSHLSNENTKPTFNPEFKVYLPNNTVIPGTAGMAYASPIGKYLWHDLFAFGVNGYPTVTTSSNGGSSWATSTNTDYTHKPFIKKENQSITVLKDGQTAIRWQWFNNQFHACQAKFLNIGFTYQSPIGTFTITFETSKDGTTWTKGFEKTGCQYNQAPYWFFLNTGWASEYYVRLTLTRTSSSGSIGISGIKLLTSRWGDQGRGSEYEYPYDWDIDQNIFPRNNNTAQLGTQALKWKDVYATTFHGALDGNATSATTASSAAKVNHTLSTNTKYSLSGTTLTASGSSDVVFDTGIYTDTTPGHLVVTGGIDNNGALKQTNGHVYLTGAQPTSSTGNTTQIVFGTESDQHIALSSNRKLLVINPTTSSTGNQILFYLDQASKIPSGLQVGSAITPIESGQTSLGTTNLKFSSLHLSGDTSIGGSASIAGNLTVNQKAEIKNTLVLSKTQDASGTANNEPALIVGGTATTAHIEIDNNEILAKSNGTTPTTLNLNTDGGATNMGGAASINGKLTLAGNIAYTNVNGSTNYTDYDMIKFIPGTGDGAGMVIGGGGAVIIGSGESAAAYQGTSGANIAGNSETMAITADSSINFVTNCQTIANRVQVNLDGSRQFYPVVAIPSGETTAAAGSLGTNTQLWNKAYIKSIYATELFQQDGAAKVVDTITGGTANTIPKFSDANTIENSKLTDDGTTLTYDGKGSFKGLKSTLGNEFICSGNEFNFIPSNQSGAVYINYETSSRDHTGNVTEYRFCSGKAADGDSKGSLRAWGLTLLDNASIGGTLTVTKGTSLSTLTTSGDTSIGGAATVAGNLTVKNKATIEKGLTVTGDASITNLLTVGHGSNHFGIKIGNSYISAIEGRLIFQGADEVRFGPDNWQYDNWAGLKYDSSNKAIYLGLADNTIFTANNAQSGGRILTPGIKYFNVGNQTAYTIADGSTTSQWVQACNGESFINSHRSPGDFSPMLSGATTNGRMTVAFYNNALQATYITKANCDANSNTPAATAKIFDESGGGYWPGSIGTGLDISVGGSLVVNQTTNLKGNTTIGASEANTLTVNATATFGPKATFNKGIFISKKTGIEMEYTSGGFDVWMYPKGADTYGIRYFEGTPDKMAISASGNNSTTAGADLCINGNGDGTITMRGKNIPHTNNTTGTVGSDSKPVYVNAGAITEVSIIEVSKGGTGASTLTSGQALIGNGTGAVTTRAILNNTSVGASGWAGTAANNTQLITHNTLAYWNGAYSSTSSNLEYCKSGKILATASAGTTNYLPKFTGATTLGDSGISDNGTTITLGRSTVVQATTTNYSEGLRILPHSTGWGLIFFSANSTTTGTHDGGWLVGRMGVAGGAGQVGDFTIENNNSTAKGLTIHKADASISVHGPKVNFGNQKASMKYNSTDECIEFIFN